MPNTQCKKCRHGYIAEMCSDDHPSVILPCTQVPACPVIPVEDDEVRYPVMLTRDEMRFIRGVMAGMGALPIAQSVRDSMNEGEHAATVTRARVNR